MSTFTLGNSSPAVEVHLASDITQNQLLNFLPFKNWLATLQHSLSLQHSDKSHSFHESPYKLRNINVQSVDWFGGGKRLGFVKLQAEVSNDQGERLPGSVFLRGGSVGMMVILQPDDVPEGSETDKHVILTVQPRIPAGSLCMTELPAGMVDDGTFSGTAAQEIKEEVGLEIPEDQLIEMSRLAIKNSEESTGEKLQRAMYSSAGGSDEFLPLFLHQRRVPRDQLKEWQGKLTGLREHGEKITLRLVPLEKLFMEAGHDAKALAALALYEGLRKQGKIKG